MDQYDPLRHEICLAQNNKLLISAALSHDGMQQLTGHSGTFPSRHSAWLSSSHLSFCVTPHTTLLREDLFFPLSQSGLAGSKLIP